jgi:hypothetical protein
MGHGAWRMGHGAWLIGDCSLSYSQCPVTLVPSSSWERLKVGSADCQPALIKCGIAPASYRGVIYSSSQLNEVQISATPHRDTTRRAGVPPAPAGQARRLSYRGVCCSDMKTAVKNNPPEIILFSPRKPREFGTVSTTLPQKTPSEW